MIGQTEDMVVEQHRLTESRRRQILRNVVIYSVGVMALSITGGIVLAGGNEVGALLFLAGPLLMAILLRALGRDGWADAGLRLGSLRWYVFALLIFPMTFAMILGVGALTDSITVTGTFGALLSLAALEVVPRLVFAGFEEWGWRGYLESRLTELGVPDLRRHLIVGVIWAVWHIPYILSIPDYSDLSPVVLAPLLLIGVIAMAVVYGQLRKASNSVWPVVLAHGMGNILAFPLVFGGLTEFMHPAAVATRPESLLFIAIWIGIGWVMLRRSKEMEGLEGPMSRSPASTSPLS